MPKFRRAVRVVEDPDKIRLVADPERAEILRLLGTGPMTETMLSEHLALTKAAVGYHLNLLAEAGFIQIEKSEAEEHGILQKYYSPTTMLFIVDPDRIGNSAQKFFVMKGCRDYLRGFLSIFQMYENLHGRRLNIPPQFLEKLSVEMLRQVSNIGRRYEKEETTEDTESIRTRIYIEAALNLIRNPAYRKHLGRLGALINRLQREKKLA